jgi:hypothetical protein
MMEKGMSSTTPGLQAQTAPQTQAPRARILDVQGAADYLGLPVTTLRYWLIRPPAGLPTPLRSGTRIYFRAAELERWSAGDPVPQVCAAPAPAPVQVVEVAVAPMSFPAPDMPVRLAKRKLFPKTADFLETGDGGPKLPRGRPRKETSDGAGQYR